jgi:hypothetical protein
VKKAISPYSEKLFNIIFDTGVLPQSWLNEIIKPIYKNKGDVKDPMNYRPITIISCLGKLFTAILNAREKRKRDRFSLCLTPISQLKYPVV